MKSSIIKVDGVDIPIWESDSAKSWRMVYNAGKCLDLFEAEGITATKFSLFEGTKQQCLDEATRLALTDVPDVDKDPHAVVVDEVAVAIQEAYSLSRPTGITALEYAVKVLTPLLTKTPTKEEIETAVTVADTKLEEEGKIPPKVEPKPVDEGTGEVVTP